MTQSLAISIDYWGYQEGSAIEQLTGITEFQNSLSHDYEVSRVHGRPGDLGSGLYEMAIRVIANISIHDIVSLIASGIVYDLIKSGTKNFALRPFLAAYKKLQDQNKDKKIDIFEVKFEFNDAEIFISKIDNDSIYENIGRIFQTLAENFEHLKRKTGESPYSIYIPVFEDPEKKLCDFRTLLDVDETITNVTSDNYFEYWGVRYDFERISRVFDIKKKILIDSDFFTHTEYWAMYDIHVKNKQT